MWQLRRESFKIILNSCIRWTLPQAVPLLRSSSSVWGIPKGEVPNDLQQFFHNIAIKPILNLNFVLHSVATWAHYKKNISRLRFANDLKFRMIKLNLLIDIILFKRRCISKRYFFLRQINLNLFFLNRHYCIM